MNEADIKRIVENTVASAKARRKKIDLELANALADATLAEAKRQGVCAVVCVSDEAGNPKVIKCMDGAYIASYDIALNKAFTSVALKTSTAELKRLAQPGASLYGIQFTNGGRIVIFGGGETLKAPDGSIVGGLGVSGGTEDEDSYLSSFGKRYFETKL